jgi:hypothetical protein
VRFAYLGFAISGLVVAASCSPASGGNQNRQLFTSGSGGSGTLPDGSVSAGGYYNAAGNAGFPTFGAGGAMASSAGGAPSAGGDTGSTTDSGVPPGQKTPVTINENPGNLDPGTQQQLQGGGSSGAQILYPYDGTVFPVGLLPPTIQWQQSGGADAVYLHIKGKWFEYQGFFGSSANLQLTIPANAWKTAGEQSDGAVDPYSVEITIKSGASIIGPVKETLIFAQGKLKGQLFYNTYTSAKAGDNGAVMRLVLGAAQPDVFLTDTGVVPFGPCWSCHSLSANGAMLVAQHHQYPGGPYWSSSFDLVANPQLKPPALATLQGTNVDEMGLGAVYPDGSKVLTMGSPSSTSGQLLFPDGQYNVPAMLGPMPSHLLDTRTGTALPVNGWTVQYAMMPSFSPDGSKVVFNWFEDSQGHSLAVADFDTNTNTFSNIHVVYKNPNLWPGWPWITPDNKEVVFVLGNADDFVSAYPSRPIPASSDLWTVDIANPNGQARQLARANGYKTNGGPTYLPQPNRDEHVSYFPTMSPIAAGGYFWVFFTSRRTYGNTITQPVDQAITKKIWVTAYNIRTGDVIADPSNPPFYLPGQEDVSGNIRAFAALEPCHADGASCETGVDCCGQHCYQGKCQLPPPPPPPKPHEPPPPPPCSQLDEGCNADADCCDSSAVCISHYCSLIAPPQ